MPSIEEDRELEFALTGQEIPQPTLSEVAARVGGVDTSVPRRGTNLASPTSLTTQQELTSEERARRLHQREEQSYTFSEVSEAAFNQENPVSSFLNWYDTQQSYSNEYDPDFDVIDSLEARGKLDLLDQVEEVTNEGDLQVVLDQIEVEQKSKEILEASGGLGTGMSMVAGVLSPTTLLPVGTLLGVGKTALVMGANVAASNAVAVALDEAVLNYSQSTRTAEQSAGNILGGAILGGIVGAVGGALMKGGGRLPPDIEKNVEFTTPDGKVC